MIEKHCIDHTVLDCTPVLYCTHCTLYIVHADLKVVEAPDILYNETSNDTITMEGASISLNCEAR